MIEELAYVFMKSLRRGNVKQKQKQKQKQKKRQKQKQSEGQDAIVAERMEM
jgi:hypothetical protein